MKVQVTVNNVRIIEPSILNENEFNIHNCEFEFTEEYNGLTKKAVFTNEANETYVETIVDNICPIPSEVLKDKEDVKLGVYAYDVDNEELLLRYSPRPTEFYVHEGSYKEGQNSTPPTPSEIEQLQAQITTNANNIEELQECCGRYDSDIAEIKAEQITQNASIQNNADNIETINEQISDINEAITDLEINKANATDLNTLTERVSTNERDIDAIDGQISDINQDVADLEQDLTNYSLITETGSQINLNVNNTNYKITAILKDKNGNVIYTSNAIDLPIESMIVNARYDNTTKEIVLTLQNGNTLRISVADLISGLVSETQLQTILANYYTKTEVNNLLNAKANQTSLDITNQNVTNLTGRVSTNETDIADIKEEQTTQNTNIEELQNQVETLQEDLGSANAEIEELNTDITNMAKAMYKVEGQGSDITLENTSENKFVEFELEGRKEQEQLEGKNKFNPLLLSQQENYNTYNSSTGLWTTNSSNAWYLSILYYISGNTTRDINKLIYLPQGKYTIRIYDFVNNTSHSSPISYRLFNNLGEEISSSVSGSTTYVLNIEQDCYLDICRTNSTGTLSFSKIMIVSGEYTEQTMPSFEPYCGGIPSPNPDYPQQIKNVIGNSNVKIQNKNLMLAQKIVEDSNNASVYLTQDGLIRYITSTSRCIIKPNIIKENTAYTFKLILKSGVTANNNIGFTAFYTDGTSVSLSSTARTNRDEFEQLFTTDGTKTLDYLRSNFTSSKEAFIKIDGSMILEGSYTAETIPDYVPNQEQNYPLTLGDIELCKIDTAQDYFYKNNDKWYLHKEIDKVVFNGSSNVDAWGNATQVGTSNFYRYANSAFNDTTKYKSLTPYISDKFIFDNVNSLQEKNIISNTGVSGANRLWITIDTTLMNGTTVDDFKTWLSTHNTEVYYLLATPTDIKITDTTLINQLDAIKNAKSYDDITYITSEGDELGFDMKAIAVADANKVIDSLDTRLLALEGNTNQTRNSEVDTKNITKETAEETAENAENSVESEVK